MLLPGFRPASRLPEASLTCGRAVRCARGHAAAYPASSARRAIQRFESANKVTRCAPFLASPRYRAFTCPNCRLTTRNGCSTFARTDALARSATASADPGERDQPALREEAAHLRLRRLQVAGDDGARVEKLLVTVADRLVAFEPDHRPERGGRAVPVEVADRRVRQTPDREQDREIRSADLAVEVEVAIGRLAEPGEADVAPAAVVTGGAVAVGSGVGAIRATGAPATAALPAGAPAVAAASVNSGASSPQAMATATHN